LDIATSSRYQDLYALGIAANALALARLFDGKSGHAWVHSLCAAWVACLAVGLSLETARIVGNDLPVAARQRAASSRQIRAYLGNHDESLYSQIPEGDLPYPNRDRLKKLLDHPGMQPLWPSGIRPATLLQAGPETRGFARTERRLAQDQPAESVWSAAEGPALFVSEPLPEGILPVLQFRFLGSPDLKAGQIAILSADGKRHPLESAPLAGHRWQTAHMALPDAPKPLRIIVEIPEGDHRFAFADPVETGRLSWYSKYVLRSHDALTWAGLLLGAAVIAALAKCEPPQGGYYRTMMDFFFWCAARIRNIRDSLVRAANAMVALGSSQDPATRRTLFASGTVLVAIALFIRRPDALLNPQIWAEDGCVFLVQQVQLGWRAILEPSAGYLHLLPRLITEAVTHLDPRFWPLAFNGCSYLIWCFVCLRCWSTRLDLPGKAWLPIAIVIAPHTVEVLFNITNIQWVAALILFQQAFMRDPESSWGKAAELALFCLVSFTGPFIALMMPLVAWSAWRKSSPFRIVLFVVGLAAAFIQIRSAISFTMPQQSSPFEIGNIPHLFAVLSQRIAVLFLPSVIVEDISTTQMIMIGMLVMAIWAMSIRHASSALRPWMAASLTACVLLAAAVLRARPDAFPLYAIGYAERYFVIPRILLGWIVIWIAVGPSAWRHAARIVALLAILCQLPSYRFPPLADLHWEQYCDALRRRDAVDIPIHPGWILHYPGRHRD
ncbi:MAG: hypothetical protein WC378_17965, partial [Opitutaceae bacterium]|jgi:hypothetical protein